MENRKRTAEQVFEEGEQRPPKSRLVNVEPSGPPEPGEILNKLRRQYADLTNVSGALNAYEKLISFPSEQYQILLSRIRRLEDQISYIEEEKRILSELANESGFQQQRNQIQEQLSAYAGVQTALESELVQLRQQVDILNNILSQIDEQIDTNEKEIYQITGGLKSVSDQFGLLYENIRDSLEQYYTNIDTMNDRDYLNDILNEMGPNLFRMSLCAGYIPQFLGGGGGITPEKELYQLDSNDYNQLYTSVYVSFVDRYVSSHYIAPLRARFLEAERIYRQLQEVPLNEQNQAVITDYLQWVKRSAESIFKTGETLYNMIIGNALASDFKKFILNLQWVAIVDNLQESFVGCGNNIYLDENLRNKENTAALRFYACLYGMNSPVSPRNFNNPFKAYIYGEILRSLWLPISGLLRGLHEPGNLDKILYIYQALNHGQPYLASDTLRTAETENQTGILNSFIVELLWLFVNSFDITKEKLDHIGIILNQTGLSVPDIKGVVKAASRYLYSPEEIFSETNAALGNWDQRFDVYYDATTSNGNNIDPLWPILESFLVFSTPPWDTTIRENFGIDASALISKK